MQRTQRNERNACNATQPMCTLRSVCNERNATNATQRMQRNATDVYVAICMQRTQRMQRNATDVYVAICMQRTQRIQRNATDAYVAICMQRTQRMQRNATDAYVAICMQRTQRKQRNATDVYVAICTKACYGFNAIALTQHLRRCDTSLARVVVITERSTRALHTTLCICDTRVNRIVWLPNAAHLRWAAATRAVCGPCMVLTARWHVSQAAKPVTCLKNRVFGQNACFACRTL